MISVNPFKFGKAVTGEYFTDREEEIKTLSLDLESGQNVILYSPRRFGKTSLILKLINDLRKKDYLCSYVDLFPVSSKRDFAQRLASAITKDTSKRVEEVIQKIKTYLPKITPKIVFKPEGDMEFDIEFEESALDIDRLLTNLYDLPQNIAQKRKKKVVVVFDEFQQIGQLDGEKIEKELRSKIQHHNDVAYVFMGSKRHLMERIFNDKTRSFYNIGKRFTLRKIPKDKFAAFIQERLRKTGAAIEPTLIEKVLKITENHPYYTQMLMHEVWNESYPGMIITEDSIKRGVEQIFSHQEHEFVTLWDSLSPKQKSLLVALASDENISLHSQSAIIKYELGSPATVSKSLKMMLENKEILEQEGGRYIFSDIFFKEWIKTRDRYPVVEDHVLIEKIVLSKAPEKPPQFPLLPVLHNQTPPEPNFVGRVEMLETITEWYQNSEVRIGALIGWGGVGKSALVRKWYDSLEENKIYPDGIFWWGFYRNAYLEAFLNALLRYVSRGEIDPEAIKSTWEKVEKIKEFICDAEYLIILDGLEEMQKKEETGLGAMEHSEFKEMLTYIADANFRGLCLITTRLPLADIEKYPSYKWLDVEELSKEDTRPLFEKINVRGTQDEVDAVWEDFEGHTLSLVLLANYLAGLDIKRAEIPPFYSDKEAGGKAHRILLWYDKQLKEEQREFMKIFSLFRGAVGKREFEAIFHPKINIQAFHFNQMVSDLCKRRLITKERDTYTTYPLIKGYFEFSFDEEEKKLCHKRIYQFFGEIAKDMPETLEETQPLFEQVYHGCSAGLYDEVFDDVYWGKIHRGKELFLTQKLGAWETNLSLARTFFPNEDLSQMPQVSKKSAQAWLLNTAGLALLNTGRPKEAEEPFLTGVQIDIEAKEWENASGGYRNMAGLWFRTGRLEEAKGGAQKAIVLAEKAGSEEYIVHSKAYLGWILHLLGKDEEAGEEFRQADELSRKISEYRLYCIWGVFYADFLISTNQIDEALDLTQANLDICQRYNWLNDISRCHRCLGAIERLKENHQEAEVHLQISLEIARKIGVVDLEIEALLESGRLWLDMKRYEDAIREANQVLKLCERTGFKLYEPEAELILARAYLGQKNRDKAKESANSAYEKATKMGYHWPKTEAAQLLNR